MEIHEKDTFLEWAKNSDFFVEGNWIDQIGSNFTRLLPWPATSIGKVWANMVNSIAHHEKITIFGYFQNCVFFMDSQNIVTRRVNWD